MGLEHSFYIAEAKSDNLFVFVSLVFCCGLVVSEIFQLIGAQPMYGMVYHVGNIGGMPLDYCCNVCAPCLAVMPCGYRFVGGWWDQLILKQ